MTTPRHLPALTPLRGIAAVGVLLFHFDGALVVSGFRPLVAPLSTQIVHRGYLWVDFFFVLSGFIITHVYGDQLSGGLSWRKARSYLAARFSRIYPLHLFTLATHLLFFWAVARTMPKQAAMLQREIYPLDALPLHLLMAHAMNLYDRQTWNLPSWSIAAEWWTYVVAIALVPLIHRRGRARALAAAVLALAASYALIALHPKQALRINFDYGVLRCLFEFILGIAIYQLFAHGRWQRWLSHDASFLLSAGAALLLLHLPGHDLLVIPAFGAVVLTAAHNQGRSQRLLTWRPLRLLGDVSYSFYMVQGLWLILFAGALAHRRETRGVEVALTPMLIWLALLFGVTLLSAWATHRWVEIPARGWLRRRLSSKSDGQARLATQGTRLGP